MSTPKHSKGKKAIFIGYQIMLILIPIAFLLAPIDQFDTGESMCLSNVLFDMSCYGCGMTRALKHLVCFDFQVAWEYNKVAFLVLPLISWLWIKEILRVRKKLKGM